MMSTDDCLGQYDRFQSTLGRFLAGVIKALQTKTMQTTSDLFLNVRVNILSDHVGSVYRLLIPRNAEKAFTSHLYDWKGMTRQFGPRCWMHTRTGNGFTLNEYIHLRAYTGGGWGKAPPIVRALHTL